MDIGQNIEFVPLMIKGSIKILREDEEGNEIFLYYLEEGDTCAISLTCCLSSQQSNIRAVAEQYSEYICIPIEYVEKWMNKYDSWKAFIMNTYTRRFNMLLHAIDQLAFKKMDERLENYLIEKSELHQSKIIHISHLDIATDLNTSREVISRLLKQLEKMGKVRLGRNKIEMVNL
ncbi:MAG TPA: Crp/Fnr family transcriptional regulator [Cytophagales bacterium]|nr:Crp/Fnr family transcriptional regulator [Cytophagales bacterium]